MVLVEIYVACVDKTYDFRLDTKSVIKNVIDEIIIVVSQKEDMELNIDKEHITLSIVSKKIVMNKSLTLDDYNVVQGMKLMLV